MLSALFALKKCDALSHYYPVRGISFCFFDRFFIPKNENVKTLKEHAKMAVMSADKS